MATLTPSPKMQFLDANGAPLSGGKLYTYISGTTTPLVTYTDATAGTPNANPIILDSRGEANVWLGASRYSMKLTTFADALVWTADGIGGVATLSDLAASSGSSLVGFIQAGTGAVATTVQEKLYEIPSLKDYGVKANGVTDDTAALQAAVNLGGWFLVPRGTIIFSSLSIPSNTVLMGYGKNLSIFKVKNASNPATAAIKNADTINGNSGIQIISCGFDGNYLNQTVGGVISLTKCTDTLIQDCYVKNGFNSGLVFSGGSNNTIVSSDTSSNGKGGAGYGLYLFNSSSNKVVDHTAGDNCIGVAVEASGATTFATNNTIINLHAVGNRADFGQSGAGIHNEQSAGGDASGLTVCGAVCINSTGGGVVISGTNSFKATGLTTRNNGKAGLITLSALNFLIENSHIVDNGATEGAGYKYSARFDDTGVLVGSTGIISSSIIYGTGAGVSSVKSFTTLSEIRLENTRISGSTLGDGVLSGAKDSLKRPGICYFFATRVGAAVASPAVIPFDSATIATSQYNATTGVFTCTEPGIYRFETAVLNATAAIGVGIRKNGAYYATTRQLGAAANDSTASVSCIASLAAGDTVDVYCFSGTAQSGAISTFFSGSKIA